MTKCAVAHVFSKDEIVIYSTTSVFIIIVSVPVNILVLFGYFNSRSIRAKPSSMLIINMTVVQLLISLVVIPSQILQAMKPDLVVSVRPLCFFVGTTFYSLYIILTQTLACISLDRFLAVKFLRYSTMVTRKRVIAIIVFTWAYGAIFQTAIAPFALHIEYDYRLGACGITFREHILETTAIIVVYGLTPLGIIIVLNYKMAAHLWRHNRRILSPEHAPSTEVNQHSARQGSV